MAWFCSSFVLDLFKWILGDMRTFSNKNIIDLFVTQTMYFLTTFVIQYYW